MKLQRDKFMVGGYHNVSVLKGQRVTALGRLGTTALVPVIKHLWDASQSNCQYQLLC